jgi:hypothetical protein
MICAGEDTKWEEIEMKHLFLRKGRLIERYMHQMTGVVAVMILMILLTSCASPPYIYNIKSKSELKGDKKILAGRFVCFDNDAPVHCTKSGFLIFFNREGEPRMKLFRPDDAGYVYIPVTQGYYNIATFAKEIKDGKGPIFDLDPFPVVLVGLQDSVVNFGTLEVRFYQNQESKGSTAQKGQQRAQMRITHIADYNVTRSEIASRIGELTGPIRDGRVDFVRRAPKK